MNTVSAYRAHSMSKMETRFYRRGREQCRLLYTAFATFGILASCGKAFALCQHVLAQL